LPATALRLLLDILAQMVNGNGVQLIPIQAELTTQQAAELLNVSYIYLIKLVETEQLPSYLVGNEHRISTNELLTYRREIDTKRLQVLNELTAYDQELGSSVSNESFDSLHGSHSLRLCCCALNRFHPIRLVTQSRL
jgi:excisionase family DNA binding protein